MMPKAQWTIDSPIGPIRLEATEQGLCGVYLSRGKIEKMSSGARTHPILRRTVEQLSEYFAGERTHFNLPLDFRGTPFQRKVWSALTKIPYGETRSYQDIAKIIGHPKASRAVGGANGKNPVSIIIPCHRVISADGGLGGYSGGISYKKKLLLLERRQLRA